MNTKVLRILYTAKKQFYDNFIWVCVREMKREQERERDRKKHKRRKKEKRETGRDNFIRGK